MQTLCYSPPFRPILTRQIVISLLEMKSLNAGSSGRPSGFEKPRVEKK